MLECVYSQQAHQSIALLTIFLLFCRIHLNIASSAHHSFSTHHHIFEHAGLWHGLENSYSEVSRVQGSVAYIRIQIPYGYWGWATCEACTQPTLLMSKTPWQLESQTLVQFPTTLPPLKAYKYAFSQIELLIDSETSTFDWSVYQFLMNRKFLILQSRFIQIHDINKEKNITKQRRLPFISTTKLTQNGHTPNISHLLVSRNRFVIGNRHGNTVTEAVLSLLGPWPSTNIALQKKPYKTKRASH